MSRTRYIAQRNKVILQIIILMLFHDYNTMLAIIFAGCADYCHTFSLTQMDCRYIYICMHKDQMQKHVMSSTCRKNTVCPINFC